MSILTIMSDNLLKEIQKTNKSIIGNLYLEIPNGDIDIDIEEINNNNVTTLYVELNSSYLFFLWRHYDKLSCLDIIIIEDINSTLIYHNYPAKKLILNLNIFKNSNFSKVIKNIFLIGNKNNTIPLYNFLNNYAYSVKEINGEEINNYTNIEDSVFINCSEKIITQFNSLNIINEKYIFCGEIQNLIIQLSKTQKIIKPEEFINFLIISYPNSAYSPFAAISYLYTNSIVKEQKYKQSVAFYSPSCAYRNNLLTNKIYDAISQKYNTYFLYGTECNDKFEELNNSYYVGNSIIVFFEFLDAIIYPSLTTFLPLNAKKIYLVHDIYDSPTGNAEKEQKIKNKIKKSRYVDIIDYEFMPSVSVLSSVKKKHNYSKNVCLVPGGYFKLDGNIKKLNTLYSNIEIDSIIYAPTVIDNIFFKHHSQPNYGIEIIDILLSTFKNFNIIFRPHPHSINHPDSIKIVKKFEKNSRFIFDNNPSEYMQSYARSKLMITDLSGTAFTYAFTTLRPVIFFSPNENTILNDLGEISYFEDRNKLGGSIVETINDLSVEIKKCFNNYITQSKEIEKFRDKSIFNINNSENYFIDNFDYILNDLNNKEWLYINYSKQEIF